MQVSGPTVGLSQRKPWLNPAPTLAQPHPTPGAKRPGLLPEQPPGPTSECAQRRDKGSIHKDAVGKDQTPHTQTQNTGHSRAGVAQESPCPPPST